MSLFSNIISTNKNREENPSGMQNYMTLIQVYFQAALAERLSITNLAMLPDLRTYKQTFHVQTINNKLGIAEKASVRKMMKQHYRVDDNFFSEIDTSIKKNCRKLQDAQTYLYQFQAYAQNLMMLLGNLMRFKLRIPGIFKKMLYGMTQKTIADIFNKNDFSDAGVIKTVVTLRQINKRLAFSQRWTTDFAFQLILLAKKEPRQNTDDEK